MARTNPKKSTQNEKKDWGEVTPEAVQALCVRFFLFSVSFKTVISLFTENADFITSSPMHHVACYIVIRYYGESTL